MILDDLANAAAKDGQDDEATKTAPDEVSPGASPTKT